MNPRTLIPALMLPLLLILTLLVAIPLLFEEETCGTGATMGTPQDGLTVAAWNLWDAGPAFTKRVPYLAQRIAGVHPDLIMLQEAGVRQQGVSAQRELAERTGLQPAGPGSAARKLLYDGSRLVNLDSRLIYLPTKGSASRYALAVTFKDLRTRKVFVAVSLHLRHSYGRSWDRLRGRQMTSLLRSLRHYAGSKPVIIGGDFNTSKRRGDGTAALDIIKSRGYLDTAQAPNTVNAGLFSSLGATGVNSRNVRTEPGQPIDFVFASKNTTLHWWAMQPQASVENDHYSRVNSDHNIITAGITLPGDATPDGATPSPATTTAPSDDASPAAARAPLKSAAKRVGRWGPEQIKNAAIIASVGQRLHIPKRGQVVAIMTAMGESSLRVVNRGDAAGPDSRGLFQQRANGAWGSYADRMSPAKSAESFYRALERVAGWSELEPTQAAHRVQRNADPNHYAPFWDEAMAVYAATQGISLTANDLSSFAPECAGDDALDAAFAYSDAKCDFGGNYSNPRSCGEALAAAARIAKTSACKSDLAGGNWRRWCLAFVAKAYGNKFAGYPTAMSMYRDMNRRGLIRNSKTIPAGALVFFRSSDPAGHVALYAGDGKAFSNDYVRSGCIDLTPMGRMGGDGKYLGWSPPAFNT